MIIKKFFTLLVFLNFSFVGFMPHIAAAETHKKIHTESTSKNTKNLSLEVTSINLDKKSPDTLGLQAQKISLEQKAKEKFKSLENSYIASSIFIVIAGAIFSYFVVKPFDQKYGKS